MLKKENRLHKREVELVFKKGSNIKEGFLILKYLENKEKDPLVPRFAIIVPTKVSKKPTKRNRIKRQIRESLRKKIDKINNKSIDGLIIALPEILEKDYWEIDKNIEKILRRI